MRVATLLMVLALPILAACHRDPHADLMRDLPAQPYIRVPLQEEDDLMRRYNALAESANRWAHLMGKGVNDRTTATEISRRFRKLEQANGWVGER